MAYKNANFLKELRNKFRQLNASLFLLDLGLCIAWTIKSKLSLVQIQTETFSFLSCQVQTNGITATLYTVNILLFVGLILVIIQQSTVESSAHDESTTLTVIAVSIAIGFTLIEILSSYGTDFHSDFHVVLCIWAFTTVVLLAVIVPVIIVVMQDYRHKSQKTKVTIAKSELNGTGRESASRDVPTFSRASITTSKQTNLASKADNQKSVLLGDQLQSGENTTRLGERSPAGAKKSQLGETSPLLGRSHQKGEQPLFSTHCQRAVYKFMPLQQVRI
ncbi:hypothetical protein BC830DRAFT_447146 [Chytriomyces sp. MP71]|nr:hypothetical protein BC830DRAFT_447146 [Chytriomyces sp. MP71]